MSNAIEWSDEETMVRGHGMRWLMRSGWKTGIWTVLLGGLLVTVGCQKAPVPKDDTVDGGMPKAMMSPEMPPPATTATPTTDITPPAPVKLPPTAPATDPAAPPKMDAAPAGAVAEPPAPGTVVDPPAPGKVTPGKADSSSSADPAKPPRWEKSILAFESQDKKAPPPTDGILFVGSSSIRMWDLKKWFPQTPVINRGFGGSQTSDVLQYFDRIVLPYKPKAIVFYSGENDLASGKKSPEKIVADMKTLIEYVKKKLPGTKFIMVSVKPSVKRREYLEQIAQIGAMQKKLAAEEGIAFVDVYPAMVDKKGEPRTDIFLKDNLHMNDTGYALWVERIAPLIGAKVIKEEDLPKKPAPSEAKTGQTNSAKATKEAQASVISPPSISPPSISPPELTVPSIAPPSTSPPSIAPPSIEPPSISPPSIEPGAPTKG